MPAITPVFDAPLTATIAAMFGAAPGTAGCTVASGATTLSVFTLPGATVGEPVTVSANTTTTLDGLAPASVDASDGAFILAVSWDGATPTPLDTTPTVGPGHTMPGLGGGQAGWWYTGAGGTAAAATPAVTTAAWSGTPALGTTILLVVVVDIDSADPGGTLTSVIDWADVTAGTPPEPPVGYRPPVARYPNRSTPIIGDRSPFRRR